MRDPDTPGSQVELIAYADRLGGTIPALAELLDGPLEGIFGGIHLLPFFVPFDGADHGFDPIDHTTVDPRLGSWEDVARLARRYAVTADLIVNHISADSVEFRDFLEHGAASPYATMFHFLSSVFPDGATEDELLRIYRPRPGLPLTPVRLADGSRRLAWTTFTARQIDLDVDDPRTSAYLEGIAATFAEHGVSTVRLDAVGYAVKTPGTSCFMTPATLAFIGRLQRDLHRRGLRVLVEVHAHHARQIEVAQVADLVYDFALPPLVLWMLADGDASPLRNWLALRPRNAVTVLDTHDGIGVIDVGPDDVDPSTPGLLSPDQISALVEWIHANTRGASRQATGARAGNVDVYQVNTTFYDAVGRSDTHYLTARAIQLFTPGIPQIYYVGLLAGENDLALMRWTGVGRDINRRSYDRSEVETALGRPVVQDLLALIRFRNRFPAFTGSWTLGEGTEELTMRWDGSGTSAELRVDAAAGSFVVEIDDGARRSTATCPADLAEFVDDK